MLVGLGTTYRLPNGRSGLVGASGWVTIVTTVNAAYTGTLHNTAGVTMTNGTTETNMANNSDLA